MSMSDSNNNRMGNGRHRASTSPNDLLNKNYLSDDQSTIMRMTDEKRNFVKRTKSFWRFGKASSEEVLEGMALWKHRDLVDVEEQNQKGMKLKARLAAPRTLKASSESTHVQKPSRDHSNDSDKTLNATQYEDNPVSRRKVSDVKSYRSHSGEQQKLSMPAKQQESGIDEENFEDYYDQRKHNNMDDQFYDDEDGLIMRTVNRKNILQQYNNDSTGPDSGSETEITSDDPYDCIVVDDQTQKVRRGERLRREKVSNVPAIAKKLEKFSRSSKYTPDQQRGNQRMDNVNVKNERNRRTQENNGYEGGEVISYRGDRNRNSFKTFGVEIHNDENGEKEINKNDRYYNQMHNKRNDVGSQEKRRYYREGSREQEDRRKRSSYESINSEAAMDHLEMRNGNAQAAQRNAKQPEVENREKLRHYTDTVRDPSVDEFSDGMVLESRQFLPRTKLTKTNSNGSHAGQEVGLIDYGETLKRRMKNADHGQRFDEIQHNGNMYGPWYDLWGLDASARK